MTMFWRGNKIYSSIYIVLIAHCTKSLCNSFAVILVDRWAVRTLLILHPPFVQMTWFFTYGSHVTQGKYKSINKTNKIQSYVKTQENETTSPCKHIWWIDTEIFPEVRWFTIEESISKSVLFRLDLDGHVYHSSDDSMTWPHLPHLLEEFTWL